MKESAKRLKELRMELGLSQRQMAPHFGIERAAYSRMELGENNISEFHLNTIAREWGISVNWLVLGVGPKYLDKIGKIDFGDFTDNVNEMIIAMKASTATLHAMLASFHQRKEGQSD